jgi:hypothetical protein
LGKGPQLFCRGLHTYDDRKTQSWKNAPGTEPGAIHRIKYEYKLRKCPRGKHHALKKTPGANNKYYEEKESYLENGRPAYPDDRDLSHEEIH